MKEHGKREEKEEEEDEEEEKLSMFYEPARTERFVKYSERV